MGEKTNLIVNYLPQTLTDDEFRSMFLSIGPINTCKIIRDKATAYSYGFGFVDYKNEEDAQRAIETLNGLQLQNKKIKVALARAGGEEIKGANLYVRQLPPSFTSEELHTMFQPFGNIIQARVLLDQVTGVSKRVGFVLYDKKEEADAATASLNNTIPTGSTDPISVKAADDNAKKVKPPPIFFPRFPSPGPIRNAGNRMRFNPMNNVGGSSVGCSSAGGATNGNSSGHVMYIYNIGYDANERTLWTLFSPFGRVQKVNVIYDHTKQQCKGYGFVTMENYYEAQCAIQSLNGYRYNGRPLQVSFYTKK